jgi:hypothetical protein
MRKQQPGLRDIGRRVIDVRVGDVALQVRGLSARDILDLMQRFDPVRRLFEGGREEVAKHIAGKNAPQTLIASLPDAVWSAMATCTGTTPERRDADERAASELELGDQIAIINAIFEATFREGVGPFMMTLDRLAQIMRPMQEPTTTPTQAPASRNVSPPRSPAALHVDLPPERLGRLHLAS